MSEGEKIEDFSEVYGDNGMLASAIAGFGSVERIASYDEIARSRSGLLAQQ